MSFRDRHRFLNGVYNSHPDPALITAEDISGVAQSVGLLMEEVLSWFKDEKSRRTDLLANNQHSAQKSSCHFPPSPESIRGSGEVSSASSANSPGTPSGPQDTSSLGSASVDQPILAPPKAKRGRPAKAYVKIEPDLPSPGAKRKKMSAKYPCPDCQNYVAVERWAEHINRKHFPRHVWQCPKTNRQTGKSCSSSPHYRAAYREDNFATHLKGEHDCPDTEVAELKKTCKFEVMGFFHKVCGFESCDASLKTRDESIEHIKDHFRRASEEPNPLLDLGLSLWKERCASEHKLQLGIHYQRTQASKPDPTHEDRDHDRDGDKTGGSGEGNSDNLNHDNSRFRSSSSSHDHDKSEGDSDNTCNDSSGSQPNSLHAHPHDGDSKHSQETVDTSGNSESIDTNLSQEQRSIGSSKMNSENAPTLPSISSLMLPPSDARSESSTSQEPQSPAGTRPARTRKLTTKEDANFQRHIEDCGKLFGRSRHIENGCSKIAHVEASGGVSVAETTNDCPRGSCKEEADFPLYPDPLSTFSPHPKSESSNAYAMYAEEPPYEMESPELRAPSSNYSTASCTSTRSSAMDSPYLIRTPLYGIGTPEFSTGSNYSAASDPSAFSSSIGSPYPFHGHNIPVPEWDSRSLGLIPSIDSYDPFGCGNEYSLALPGMEDFSLAFNPTKPGFVGEYKILSNRCRFVQSTNAFARRPLHPSPTIHQSLNISSKFGLHWLHFLFLSTTIPNPWW